MTLGRWAQGPGASSAEFVSEALARLGRSGIDRFPETIVVAFSGQAEFDTRLLDLRRTVGPVMIPGSFFGSGLLLPAIPMGKIVSPRLLIPVGFAELESPIRILCLNAALSLFDWHFRYRSREETGQPSQSDQFFYLIALNEAAAFAFGAYREACDAEGVAISRATIRGGFEQRLKDIVSGKASLTPIEMSGFMIDAMDNLAKDRVMSSWGEGLWEPRRGSEEFLDPMMEGLVGPAWPALRRFFSRGRSFEEAIADCGELELIMSKMSQTIGADTEKAVQEALGQSDDCARLLEKGKTAEAVRAGRSSLETLRRSSPPGTLAMCYGNLHMALLADGDDMAAESLYEEAHAYCQATGDQLGLAQLAMNRFNNSWPEVASCLPLLHEALECFNRHPDQSDPFCAAARAECLKQLGTLYAASGDRERAAFYLTQAIKAGASME
jgi:hypothetical protein